MMNALFAPAKMFAGVAVIGGEDVLGDELLVEERLPALERRGHDRVVREDRLERVVEEGAAAVGEDLGDELGPDQLNGGRQNGE